MPYHGLYKNLCQLSDLEALNCYDPSVDPFYNIEIEICKEKKFIELILGMEGYFII